MHGAQGNQLPQVGPAASPSPACPSQLQGSLIEESQLRKDYSTAQAKEGTPILLWYGT